MKKYILSAFAILAFSTCAVAQDSKTTSEVGTGSVVRLSNLNDSVHQFPPNINKMIEILNSKDSFKIIYPENAGNTYNGATPFNFYDIGFNVSPENEKYVVETVETKESKNAIPNDSTGKIFNNKNFLYDKYSMGITYGYGKVAKVTLNIKYDQNSLPEKEHEFYKDKVSQLLISDGFKEVASTGNHSPIKFNRDNINVFLTQPEFYSPDLVNYISIIFAKEQDSNKTITTEIDYKNREQELNYIFK